MKEYIVSRDTAYEFEMGRFEELQELIRCKDCKFATITDGVYGREPEVKYCDIWFPEKAEYMPISYYCASAERKDNG